MLIPIRAALWNMDTSLEESARALGRTQWQTFRSVTLPMLRPAILAGGLLAALYALSDFGAVAIMRYETFTWSIFIQYGAALNRTLAAAWSLGLIVLALAVVWGEYIARNAGGGRYYRSGSGAARLPAPGTPGSMALGGPGLLRPGGVGVSGPAGGRARVLDGQGRRRR